MLLAASFSTESRSSAADINVVCVSLCISSDVISGSDVQGVGICLRAKFGVGSSVRLRTSAAANSLSESFATICRRPEAVSDVISGGNVKGFGLKTYGKFGIHSSIHLRQITVFSLSCLASFAANWKSQ